LAKFGLTTPQWLLLAVLHRGFGGQPTRIGDAATAYGTSRQNVKRVALQLQSRGYLEILPDERDRRATLLHLTPKVAVFDASAERRRQGRFFNDLVRSLDDEALTTLEEHLMCWQTQLAANSSPRK